MYVRELMTPRVISVRPTDSIRAAREELSRHRIHHLLVLEQKRIVGVLAYRDLIGKADALTVAEVMSRDVVTVVPTDTARNAAALLLGRSHGCAAVLEAGVVTGVLTTTDLVRAISGRQTATA
jgi:CBS domain-containing protein